MSICKGGIAALVLLGLWEMAAQVFADNLLFVGPVGIISHIWANLGLLGRATSTTTQNAALGFIWGNLAAGIMASVVIVFPRAERVISSAALVIFCLPLVATGPILRVISGPGDVPQIALAALAVYYTTFLALRVGLRAMPANWSDLMSVYGRGAITSLVTIRARASLPYLFVGLQIAAPAAFLGAMIGEFTGAERGLGVLTLRAMRSLDVEATWSLAIISAAMAMLLYALVGRLGRWLVGYAPDIILSPPRSMGHKRWRGIIETLGAAVLLILFWQITMDLADLNRFFAKRPADVLSYLRSDADARATLLSALAQTTAATIPGYIAGLVLGAALAMAVILLPKASGVVLPVAVALRAIPIITTAPLIVLALGRGAVGTIAVIAIMIFFPTFVACLQGLRQTPRQVTDLFRSYGTGPITVLCLAQIPTMLPAFFAAAKMAVPAAILAVTTTEWLVTGKGIGLLVALTSTTSNYNMLWSCILATTLLAVGMYAVVVWLERVILSKYASEQVI
ncbi:ABC transporter permease [Roseobacter litoralis]|uniref:Binding-protein-dependent transport protein, inner membrane component n=1 Tax=Roseobacter litoralis (strain ATCC 49566 / DSM 6996 / JCM 21268 / NBRC 15278 / OCh 149) TaxID=391595 RepID=F7ZLS2_ROSLO|nr:ABC transporter permease subunit [Roseobacter litoralis]AEI94123.1 putative binding-protein-dependent transport protein, inner membrane component [Roseobacter litoralis Och 149]